MKNYLTSYNRNNHPFDLIDSAFDDFFRPLFYDEKLDAMKTDIRETKDSYIIDVEMPGFDKEDINLDVDNGYLTIRAEKKEKDESGKEDHRYVRKERSVSCQRSYYIGDTEEDAIKAKYDKGVLTVTLPKKEEKKPESKKSIAIE